VLQAPIPCGFDLVLDSVTGRATTGSLGTTITGHANADTKATYVELFDSVAYDVYAVRIIMGALSSGTSTRMGLLDIATDPTGGTTYVPVINNLGFNGTGTIVGTAAWSYFFPLFIKAGSSIAVTHQCGTGGVDASVRMWLYCKPTRPESWRSGSFVETYGATTASTTGTAVTPGTVSEGAWASLGTTAKSVWYWQTALLVDDSTMGGVHYDADLGVGNGTTNDLLITGASFASTSGETVIGLSSFGMNECIRPVVAGAGIYGRAQCSGTADSGVSMIAYGLGG
jgi:hypothetical protein